MSDAVLLTGATGFLGMELLARLIEEGDRDVICLIRPGEQASAQERLAAVIARLYDEPPDSIARVRALAGDVAAPGLGLAPQDRATLRETVTSVVHCAASISFDNTLEQARTVNTGAPSR